MTDAGGKLAMAVTIRDENLALVTFLAGSKPPAWALPHITNPKAWGPEDPAPTPEAPAQEVAPSAPEEAPPADAPDADDTPAEDLVGELPEPPKRGAGSGRPAWAAYAQSKGVVFDDDASRDDIIAAVEAGE